MLTLSCNSQKWGKPEEYVLTLVCCYENFWLLSWAATSDHKWTGEGDTLGEEADPPVVDNETESAWSTWAAFTIFASLTNRVKGIEGVSDIVESCLEAPRTNLPVCKSVNLDCLSNVCCNPGLELAAILENWHYHSPTKSEGYLAPKNRKEKAN